MKKIKILILSIVVIPLLTNCSFSFTEKGGVIVWDGESIKTLLGYVAIGVLITAAVLIPTIIILIKRQRKNRLELEEKLKNKEITKKEYDEELANNPKKYGKK